MLNRLMRSVRAWFTGDARLVRKLSDANNLVAHYQEQLEREQRAARLRTLAAASAPKGCPTCRLLRERVTFLEDVLAQYTSRRSMVGELNCIRALVPTESDDQTTFDAVQACLAKVRKERDASSKALFDVAIALEEADGGRSGTYENGPPRIRALGDQNRQLAKQLAECRRDRASQSELIAKLVPPAPPWTPLPPEVPAQPVAENGGEVRP